jgi:hypothetical protein
MRKPGSLVIKDASSDEPQGFDWTTYLAELGAGVEIQTSTWTITGGDSAVDPTPSTVLTSHDASIVTGGLKTQAFFAGGTHGKKYTVTNRIVTNSAPAVTDERSFYYLIQAR